MSYVLRTNLSIVAPAMSAELGISEIELGWVLSAFALGYALFQLPGGVFGDAVGPRLAVTLLAVAWGLLTLLTGLVPGGVSASTAVAALLVIRFGVGVAHAPIFPVATGGMVANWFPVSAWGLPNGLSSAGLTLGAAATGPLIVALTASVGWRGSFFATAPLAFVLAAVWWRYTRDHPSQHPGVTPSELALIEADRPWTAGAASERGIWKAALRNREIRLLTASYFCMNYVFYLFFNWFFYYLTEVRHFPNQAGGNFIGAQWLVGAVTATLGGIVCDRLTVRFGPTTGCRLTIMTGLLLSAPLLIAGALTRDPTMAVILLCLSFGCAELTDGAFWAATMRMGGKHVAAATGVLNTGGNVVSGVGALLVPLTAAAFGWVAAVSTGAVFAVIGALLWIWIRVDRHIVGT